MRVPVISFVGYHNSGKTTILQAVVRFLSDRGFRVGVIKHSSHDFSIDVPGTDSFRLSQAGAAAVAVSSPFRMAFYQDVREESSLDDLCRLMEPEVDIILTEGFKRENRPKIEVARQETGRDLLEVSNRIALVVDFPVPRASVPVFGFDEIESLSRFIMENFLA